MDNKTEQIFIINTTEAQALIGTQNTTETTQANLQNVLTSNVCRTCAAATEFVIPIFHGEGIQNNLAEKIHKHLPIQVSEQDELPQVVCYQCASTLLAWHELVQCCVQADRALRTSLHVGKASTQQEAQPGPSNDVSGTPTEQNQEKEKDKNNFTHIIRTELSSHLQINVGEINHKFTCLECGTDSIEDTDQLARHLKYKHGLCSRTNVRYFINQNIMCEEALQSEPTSSDEEDVDYSECESKAKKKLGAEAQNYFCPFCDSIFSSATRLVFHLNSHSELRTAEGYYCTICEFQTNTKKDFVTHLQRLHVERSLEHLELSCRSCGLVASDTVSLQAHITSAHRCDELSRTVTRPRAVKYRKPEPATCPECDKRFSNKYIMLKHFRRHSEEFWYPCGRCPKRYRSRAARGRHERLAHDGLLPFVCAACGEAFATKQHRDIHQRKHTGELPYVCHTCDKRFSAKNTLDRHMDMHWDVRNYACHLCPKRFRKRTHLNYHLGTHERKNSSAVAAEPPKVQGT